MHPWIKYGSGLKRCVQICPAHTPLLAHAHKNGKQVVFLVDDLALTRDGIRMRCYANNVRSQAVAAQQCELDCYWNVLLQVDAEAVPES